MLLHDSAIARIRALVWVDLRRMRSDPAQFVILLLLPLFMMSFLTPMSKAQLHVDGFLSANGSEQAVPGIAVIFAFFTTMLLGGSFFREHEWHTWNRLRASPTRGGEIVLGKSMPFFAFLLVQLATLWLVGVFVFHLKINGSAPALLVLIVSLAAAALGLGIALVSICRTIDQLSVFANLGSLVLGGLSGALAPRSTLPHWARTLSPCTPQYWALKGFRAVVLLGGGFSEVVVPCLVLLAVGAVGIMVAAFKFRTADVKIGRT